MKAFFKFSLLLALIVVGKLAKQPAPAALAQAPAAPVASEVVLVHQVFTSEPVSPQPALPDTNNPLREPDTLAFTAF